MIRGAAEGEILQVRARVLLPGSDACLMRVLVDHKGNHRDLTVPHTEMARPESIDAVFEVTRVLAQRIEQIREITARLQAELYEIGHYTGTGKTGFALLGRLPETPMAGRQ